MKAYNIENFSMTCECGGSIGFKVVIAEDQDDNINDLGFLGGCDKCQRSSGMADSIQDAYSESQSYRAGSNMVNDAFVIPKVKSWGDSIVTVNVMYESDK